MLSRFKGCNGFALLMLIGFGALSLRASASQYFAQTSIQVSSAEVDVDLRVDQEGRQYSASTLKNIPFSFKVVGLTAPNPPDKPGTSLVGANIAPTKHRLLAFLEANLPRDSEGNFIKPHYEFPWEEKGDG